jgi:hypothetical protein
LLLDLDSSAVERLERQGLTDNAEIARHIGELVMSYGDEP